MIFEISRITEKSTVQSAWCIWAPRFVHCRLWWILWASAIREAWPFMMHVNLGIQISVLAKEACVDIVFRDDFLARRVALHVEPTQLARCLVGACACFSCVIDELQDVNQLAIVQHKLLVTSCKVYVDDALAFHGLAISCLLLVDRQALGSRVACDD